MTLQEMQNKYQELESQISDLKNAGDFDALNPVLDEAENLLGKITSAQRAEALTNKAAQPAPRKLAVAVPTKLTAEAQLDSFVRALPRGLNAVQNAAGDIFKEGANADGGYLLPVDKRQLISLIAPAELVHSKCDMLFTESNAVNVPLDEDTDWSTSLAAADVNEGADMTEQKQAFGSLDITLVKRGVYTRISNEMLADNTGVGEYVVNKLGRKLGWKLHAICVAAFLASPAKIEVAKTVGALAGSAPDLANIQKMWTSMIPQHRANAVWLANPQLETQLQNLRLSDANGNVFPVYIPAGGISGAPYASIYGRPVLFIEGLPAVGTTGDLMLVDPTAFYCLLKTQGARIESSIHAEFKADVTVFRAYVRAACKSKLSGTITRSDGTTAGNVVTVGTRA